MKDNLVTNFGFPGEIVGVSHAKTTTVLNFMIFFFALYRECEIQGGHHQVFDYPSEI